MAKLCRSCANWAHEEPGPFRTCAYLYAEGVGSPVDGIKSYEPVKTGTYFGCIHWQEKRDVEIEAEENREAGKRSRWRRVPASEAAG